MSNEITSEGIVTDDLSTIVSDLETSFKNIYGQDINVEQSTPDGQAINIFAQAKEDTLNLAVQTYNCFNADTVIGRPQDNLYKLVGLYRKSSQFTFVQVNVTVTQAVNLEGLDDDIEDINGTGYTVADTNGNNFILSNSTTLSSAGTYLLEFRAQEVGAIQVLPNTITNMVTVLRGVSGVNNPSVQYSTGNDEETDAEFRVRFNKSRGIASQGFEESLESQLLNINLVTDVSISQNRTNTTNADGTAAHTVWAIVEGGEDDDIAQVLYANVTDGAGMRGETEVQITKSNGLVENIYFDRPISEPLYIQGTIRNLTTSTLDTDAIKEYLVNNLTLGIYEPTSGTEALDVLYHEYKSTFLPYGFQVGINGTNWYEYLYPSTKRSKFTLSAENISLTVV